MSLLLVILLARASAQDSHHWSQQYGTRSTLLGGAVIGSVSDLSATYYNPGALSLAREPRFLLTARVIQSTKYTLTSGLSENTELGQSRLAPSPALLVGRLRFGWLKDNHVAYSFLARHKVKLKLEGRRIDSRDVIVRSDGIEEFVGDARLDEDLSEVWVGLTWARKVSPDVGLGVTQYLAVRNHSGRTYTVAQALTSLNELAVTIQSRDYDYNNVSLLWKFGLSTHLSLLDLGVSLTTPGLRLKSSGKLGFNRTITAQDIDGNGSVETELTAGYQEGLDVKMKSPLSIGAGAAYTIRSITVHGSVEWFDDIAKFTVMESSPIVSQSSGELITASVTHAVDDIINFGIGLEQSFSDSLDFYASFSTDFSTYLPEAKTNLSVTTWNIYHFTGGISTKVGKALLTLGLGYSYGSNRTNRPIDFADANETNQLIGTASDGEFKYEEYKIIIGFSL